MNLKTFRLAVQESPVKFYRRQSNQLEVDRVVTDKIKDKNRFLQTYFLVFVVELGHCYMLVGQVLAG